MSLRRWKCKSSALCCQLVQREHNRFIEHDMKCGSGVIMEDILDVTASHARIDDVTLILMHRGGNSFAPCYLGVTAAGGCMGAHLKMSARKGA